MLRKLTEGTWETLDDEGLLCIRKARKQRRSSGESDEPIVAKIAETSKLYLAKGLCFNRGYRRRDGAKVDWQTA